jgi:predicted phage terminase large subunit-like protein
MAFHSATYADKLTLYRHLVAGRRGGKTLSAAWEVVFYMLHPEEFHRDAHGTESNRALWTWVLTKDYPTGFAAITTLLEVMVDKVGLVKGKDFQYNKTEKRIEFANGGLIQFKTADDPQSLRGAGLDILWMDEAAFIPNADAYTVTSPALVDKDGLVISTTTPWGKNWLYEEFFTGEALLDPNEFRVQYTSLDNPFLKREVIERYRRRYHPMHFKQEFLASFDAFTGIALQGDWLKWWVRGNADSKTDDLSLKHLYDETSGRYRLRIYMGVDPAISLADTADHFSIAVIGVTDDNEQVFLLDTFKGRLDFGSQLDKIREWQMKWRPELIGVESNAFQKALAQQSARLDTFPVIIPVYSKGDKNTRILTMAPMFKYSKVRIHRRHADFIDQWINFDPAKKNQDDDMLDAVEIALGVAGVLLSENPHASLLGEPEARPEDANAVARAQLRAQRAGSDRPYHPTLGSEA